MARVACRILCGDRHDTDFVPVSFAVHRGAIGKNTGFFRLLVALGQSLLPLHDTPALCIFLLQDGPPRILGDGAEGLLGQAHPIVFRQAVAGIRKGRNLCRQTAAHLGQRPTDVVRQKAQQRIMRIRLHTASLTPPTRPPIADLADRRDDSRFRQAAVPHRHPALRAARTG